MKRHLFAIAVAVLLVFVLVCVVLLYRFATYNLAQVSPVLEMEQNKQVEEKKVGGSWVKDLAKLPPREYVLATNEIFMEFKSEIKKQSKVVSQLIINKNDIYSVFCLSQTLNKFTVNFSIIKQNSGNLIYIDTQDKSILKRIVDELKMYDIHSTFKEIRL